MCGSNLGIQWDGCPILGERGRFRSGKIGKIIAGEAAVGVDEMEIDVKASDEVAEAAEEAPDVGAVL